MEFDDVYDWIVWQIANLQAIFKLTHESGINLLIKISQRRQMSEF